jgi:hypothetical protein
MELRIKQQKDQFFEDGRWRAESPVTPEVDRLFGLILQNRSTAGDQALAYLLTVYMGEHHGEELVCETANRGKRMAALVKAYQACAPLTGLEPFSKFVRGSGALPVFALEELEKGTKCEAVAE